MIGELGDLDELDDPKHVAADDDGEDHDEEEGEPDAAGDLLHAGSVGAGFRASTSRGA